MRAHLVRVLAFTAACAALIHGCAGKPAPPEEPPPAPLFEDATEASGIRSTYRNGEDTADHYSILESLGGGVALIDFDGDGLLDVFLPGGGTFTGADKKTITGAPCKLYRNLGKGKFEDVTEKAGLSGPWLYTHGAAVGDIDRDGWPDLLVTGWGGVRLFHNRPGPKGGRVFVDITAKAGLDRGITWAVSAAFADLDGDGYPDLYLAQYVDWSFDKNPVFRYDGKTRDVAPPREFNGLDDLVFRNTGKLTFEGCGAKAGIVKGGATVGKSLGVIASDLDGDGRPDVYVANDTTDNHLYRNRSKPGAISLEELGMKAGVARDDTGRPNGSMGLGLGDHARSGMPALWVTNYQAELHALYRNESSKGRMLFTHETAAAGIAALGQTHVGWGTAFLDADLDGWEDLFVVNGHAIRSPTMAGVTRKQRPVLMLNTSGRFKEANARLGKSRDTPRDGRGAAFGDLENRGRTDVIISHVNEPAVVLRAIGAEGNGWIGFDLRGKGHACTVGARVAVEAGGATRMRWRHSGGSYASSSDPRLVFGLGKVDKVEKVTVTWPDGTTTTLDGPAAGRYHQVKQGKGG